MAAKITQIGLVDMQVCVPADWSDEQVLNWAEQELRCGTTYGWFIRRAGDAALAGDPERVQCDSRSDHVHIMLDA